MKYKRWNSTYQHELYGFTWSGVAQLEVLIGKLSTIDGLPASAVAAGEITSLAHEICGE